MANIKGLPKESVRLLNRYVDIAYPKNLPAAERDKLFLAGEADVIAVGNNIVTDLGLGVILAALGTLDTGVVAWEVGEGIEDWDTELIDPDGTETALENPIGIKEFESRRFWDSVGGVPSIDPTNTIEFKAYFLAEEGNGDLREFGLRTEDTLGGGVLFNVVRHGKIFKDDSFNLERRLYLTVLRAS